MSSGTRRSLLLAMCAAASLLVAGCLTLVKTPDGPTPSAAAAIQAWARVLQEFVNDRGEVNFSGLAANRSDLDSYLRFVAATRPGQIEDGPPRLAHMINAYNAMSMFNVIESGIPASHAGLRKVEFFALRKLEVGRQQMSLRSFENDVIRPYALARNDPRIHFALNCSARACPVLPRRPFQATTLEADLQRETLAFFARPENFRIDRQTGIVWLSELLDFYPEDFVPGAADSLLAYANRYAPVAAPAGFAVRFTPYDWSIANTGSHAR